MSDLLPGFRSQLERRAGELDRAQRGATAHRTASESLAAHARRRRRRWRRPHGRGLAVVVLVAGASVGGLAYAAATTLWQPQLGPVGKDGATATASDAPTDQRKALGVLRRAQTDLDRNVGSRYALQLTPGRGELVRTNAVRRLATGTGGGVVVLVPYERKLQSSWGAPRRPKTKFEPNIICVNYVGPFEGGGVGCGTTDDLLAGKLSFGLSDGECNVAQQRRDHAKAQARENAWAKLEHRQPVRIPCVRGDATDHRTHWVGLVPDGVARVQLGRRPGTRSVPVRDNLFQAEGGNPFTRDHVWLDSAGREIPRSKLALRARLGLDPTPASTPTPIPFEELLKRKRR